MTSAMTSNRNGALLTCPRPFAPPTSRTSSPPRPIPSVEAEIVHDSTYRTQATAGLELGNYIRSLGYRAHIIPESDATGPVIPMFVSAGLGQLGACGYLLTPFEAAGTG